MKKSPAPRSLGEVGFTLIEMIVVVTVIAVILPLLFSIIFTILRSQVKVYNLAQVKREGDSALVAMETLIRNNAVGIYSDSGLTTAICDTAGSSSPPPTNFYIRDKNDEWFQFSLASDAIASSSSSPIGSSQNLVSDKVRVSDFTILCAKGADFSSPLITISFTVSYNTAAGAGVTETASLPYQLRIKLRNE